MRDCEALRDDLKAWMDGELGIARRLAVRLHVSRCARCREEVAEMEQMGSDMRAADTAALGPELRAKLLAGIPEGTAAPAPARLPLWRRRPLETWAGAAAAVLVLCIVGPMLTRTHEASRSTGWAGAPGAASESAQMQMKRQMAEGPIADVSVPPMAPPMAGRSKALAMGPAGGMGPDQALARARAAGMGSLTSVADRYVKRQADITVAVEDIEAKSDSVEQMVKAAGGYLAGNELNTGDEGLRTAALQVRVPVDRFDEVLRKIAALGSVTAKRVTGEDITEQVSDEASAARSLEEQRRAAEAVLRSKTGSANLWREQEIQDLKVRVAQAQGRLDLLKKQAAMAAIGVQLTEKARTSVKAGGFLGEMGDTGRAAVNSFLSAVRVPVLALIWIVAYAPVWAPLAIGYRYAVRAQQRRAAARAASEWREKWSQAAGGEAKA